MNGIHLFLFGVLPYLSVLIFLVVTIQRYRQQTFSYSSLSSQLLENRRHFWGSVPFHYGILLVLVGHVVAFLVPRAVLAWNGVPWRLYVLEGTALAAGLLTLFGIVQLLVRRASDRKTLKVTTPSDWVLYALLLVQVVTGILVAYMHGWGSSWFASALSPWLRSLVKLSPDVAGLATVPLMVKAHIVNAWLLILFFPFTRLVHVLVIPNPYLWRKPQLVVWNRPRGGREGA
ncbi:MAG: Respiratory nitrate reductase 1 gamma chain [Planctomycetes bacterium]|nr:Respiratory nitrate reductase 1 gamma chain [Planctomycetota bacterium]